MSRHPATPVLSIPAASRAPFRSHRLAAALVLAIVAGCGGSGSNDHDHEHGQTRVDTSGRLSIAESKVAALHVFDLDSNQVEARHALKAPASAVYASPGKRYALAIQRNDDRVQLVDGGIWQEDHGDHMHDYKQGSKLLDWQLDGPRPTHYNPLANGFGSVFMDGKVASTPQVNAGPQIISDKSIGEKKLVGSQTLPTPMHGAALPLDDMLLTTLRTTPATAEDVLPTRVQAHIRQGSSYQVSATLDGECPGLHGADASGNHAVFGCIDGVLLATRTGNTFSTRKIELPHRVASLYSHASRPGHFIGVANAGTPATSHFYAIDGSTGTATKVVPEGWQDGTSRRALAFDKDGALHLLDNKGALYTLQVSNGSWTTRKRSADMVSIPTEAPFPVLVASGARAELYLSDPKGRQLLRIDSSSHAVNRRDNLDFAPGAMAWTGINR